MEEHFLTYEQSLAVKELGFDEQVLEWYNTETKEFCDVMKEVKAPLKSQFFKWVREKYGYNGVIEGCKKDGYEWCIVADDHYRKPPNNSYTYEQAENECINKIIEIINQKP